MGKADATDAKKEEKKAKKAAKKEKKARKEAKRLKKEQKRREKEARRQNKPDVTPPQESTISMHQESYDSVRNSVFHKKKIEVSLSLLPVAMKNTMAALEDSVRSMILKYTDKVGVLLTFEKIRIISNNGHGRILNELPHMHYKVAFDGLVFCPAVGCKLQGAVTESFPSHLGILVLGFFNAMIPAEALTEAGFTFDDDLQEWSKDDGSSVFTKDDKVDFIVNRIHESVGTLSMEGSKPSLSPFGNKAAKPVVEEEEESQSSSS